MSPKVAGLEDFVVGKYRTSFTNCVRKSVELRSTNKEKKTVLIGLPQIFIDLIQVFDIQFAQASSCATANSSVLLTRILHIVSEGSGNVLD
jgi:hypothetical protein